MNYWRPILKHKDCFGASIAPRGWERWLPALPTSSPCKYPELRLLEDFFLVVKNLLSISTLDKMLTLTYFLPFGRNGSTVPLGPASDTGILNPEGYTLNYNEFIVYSPNQVRMRYLLKIQFNFLQLWWMLIRQARENIIFKQKPSNIMFLNFLIFCLIK